MVDWSYSATRKGASWSTSADEKSVTWATNPTDSDRFGNWDVNWVSSRGYWKNLDRTTWVHSTALRWSIWYNPQAG